MYMEAYEAAIQKLYDSGTIDKDRVGLAGFSRTGWHVSYALTHSKFRYAAAVISDNIDGSYLGATLMPGKYEDENGASPFADGLQQWLDRAPGFNVQKVQTPIRFQRESGGLPMLLASWELFSRLRTLGKPAEFYVVPDIEYGSHNLQIPTQCLASQEGAVDWFDFWLNGHEDPASSKEGQYRRWRAMRTTAGTQPVGPARSGGGVPNGDN
jgi:hypothetical protein